MTTAQAASTPQINIIRTKQAVNCGDHAQDILAAVRPLQGETVEALALRCLTESGIDWSAPMVEDGSRPKRLTVNDTWYLTIRLVAETTTDVDANRVLPPQEPATAPESDEPVGDGPITDEPAVGEQVTDSDGDVWQRSELGWHWWRAASGGWSSLLHTWGYLQKYGPLRTTTDADRRRVGLPVSDENTPSASQNDQDARSADSGTGTPPEPENGAQGRIGWLRVAPGDGSRLLMREVPGGWADTDGDHLTWRAEDWPDAEFTPIRTLADDEVAVKRGVVRAAVDAISERRGDWSLMCRLVDALEADQ